MISAAWDLPGKAFTEVLERYGDAELDVIADYLHRAAEVGGAQADRLTKESRRSGAAIVAERD
ncbi:hypothetical protein OHA25_14315 [Nonomuraea sp. NBC_00507]|uniref:hypothetical protein n=1 Tax=Nonomuraea sp. NBC_00507 TaxID=2976002 RepID=UPI002E173C54